MNFLKSYSRINKLAYRSFRTFTSSTRGPSSTNPDNNSQSTRNPTGSSTPTQDFHPTGTSKFDNIYEKPAEPLTSPHKVSTSLGSEASVAYNQDSASGSGRAETLKIPRNQPESGSGVSRSSRSDFADQTRSSGQDYRREPSKGNYGSGAGSALEDLANTAAGVAGSAVKGLADVASNVASNLGTQSSNRRDQYDDRYDRRYDDRYDNRRRDRYDDRDSNPANAAANVVGSVVKGIADTASNVASSLTGNRNSDYNRGSYDNRNRGITETIVNSAIQGAANAAGSVVSSLLSGNQNRPRRDYDDYRGRPSNNSPLDSVAKGVATVAKNISDGVNNLASNLAPGERRSDQRNPYDYDVNDRYRNRDNRDHRDRDYESNTDRVSEQVNRTAQDVASTARDTANRVSSRANDFVSSASGAAENLFRAAGSAAMSAATAAASTINLQTSGRLSFTGSRARDSQQEHRGLEHRTPPHGSKKNYEIIISGGGVNGGALACALGHSQYFGSEQKKILVLDPMEAPSLGQYHRDDTVPDQRVVSLSLGSVNFLRELGVWDLLNQNRLGTINQMQVWEVGGNSFIKFNEDPSKQIGYVIENSHLQAAIYERMRELGNIELGTSKIVDVMSQPNSFATVVLNDEDVLSARLVVGSDGTNSLVRNKARIPVTGWSSHQQGIVCTVKTPYHNTTAWQRFLTTGPLAVLPLWDEYSSIVWSCENNFHQSLMQINDEEFLRELNYSLSRKPLVDTPNFVLSPSARFDLPPVVTEICNKRRSFPLGMQQAGQFVAERIALIGDAAHNIHPLAGQGLNLGLTDAAYLANVIVKNLKIGNDIGRQDLLMEYETLSMNINRTMMYGLEFIKRSYEANQYDSVVLARNLSTSFINNLTPMKGMFTDVANGKYFQPSDYEWKKDR